VFVALGIQHAMRMRHVVFCGLSGFNIFLHIILKKARFSKKKRNNLLNIRVKCVSIFSTILSEAFLILRITEQDRSKMYTDLHVKYPLFLSGFNETKRILIILKRTLKYQVS
jgi:hypothetical protein